MLGYGECINWLIVILGITGGAIYKYMTRTRERGPWVVTRVGVEGREFIFCYAMAFPPVSTVWTSTPDMAFKFPDRWYAHEKAKSYLADVAPLSKYTGVDRG